MIIVGRRRPQAKLAPLAVVDCPNLDASATLSACRSGCAYTMDHVTIIYLGLKLLAFASTTPGLRHVLDTLLSRHILLLILID
jgi:hypothetical protein